MAKARPPHRRTRERPFEPWRLFLLLVPLVVALVLLGNLHYGWLLAAGSVVFVGFFGWRAWARHHTETRAPARRTRKHR